MHRAESEGFETCEGVPGSHHLAKVGQPVQCFRGLAGQLSRRSRHRAGNRLPGQGSALTERREAWFNLNMKDTRTTSRIAALATLIVVGMLSVGAGCRTETSFEPVPTIPQDLTEREAEYRMQTLQRLRDQVDRSGYAYISFTRHLNTAQVEDTLEGRPLLVDEVAVWVPYGSRSFTTLARVPQDSSLPVALAASLSSTFGALGVSDSAHATDPEIYGVRIHGQGSDVLAFVEAYPDLVRFVPFMVDEVPVRGPFFTPDQQPYGDL